MKKKFITKSEYNKQSKQAVLQKDYAKILDLNIARFENLLQEGQGGPSCCWHCAFCSIYRVFHVAFQTQKGCHSRGRCPVCRICSTWINSWKDLTMIKSVLQVLKSKRMRDRCKQYTKKLRAGKDCNLKGGELG